MRFRIDDLPRDATEDDIRQLFSGYGTVLAVTLLPVPAHGKQLGSGIIELENIDGKQPGAFPDGRLFDGIAMRLTREPGAEEGRASPPATPTTNPHTSMGHPPDNRGKNTLHVISIDEVLDSVTGKPNGWCRYSIESLGRSIAGLRHGSVAEVRLHAETAAEAFNLRNTLGQGRSPTWSSRSRK